MDFRPGRLGQLEEKGAKKSDSSLNAIAVIASFFVSGLGQAIKGHFKRAIAFFVAEAISFVLLFVLIGFITLPIVWIWGMYDAYKLEPKK